MINWSKTRRDISKRWTSSTLLAVTFCVLTVMLLWTQIANAQGTTDMPAVTADSVTPNTGTGTIQTFALAYRDTAGTTDLQQTWVWFNPTFSDSAAQSCMVYYDRGTNLLYLINDAGSTWLSAALGSGILQNNQCAIALGNSTAVASGNTLTLTLAMTFRPAFVGTQTIFTYATNGTQASGWQTVGTWTVPAGATPVLTADSVTPNTGTGAIQTFALAYGDTAGALDLRQTWVWFNPTFSNSAAHSCMAYYDLGTNLLYLINDAGSTWLSAALGSGILQNSQCAIALGNSTAVPSGNTLTLTLAMTFRPAFTGTETVFMYGTNGSQTSGWQTRGVWTAPAGATPVITADSVTPNTGTGITQTFAFAYGDSAGALDLQQTWLWFNPTFSNSAAHSCMVYYDLGTNLLYLINDAGGTWLSAALGTGKLQNSQCAITLASSTVVPSGNTLTLTLAMTFTPAFVGTQTIFTYATNGTQTSGWQTRGTWTVPAPATPVVTADSVVPNTGTGDIQTFALAYGDTAGATDLQQTWVWFTPTFSMSAARSCMAYYQPGTNTLNLIDDAGATWLSAPLGGSGTLQNSQCAIVLGSSTAVLSGNTLTLTLAVTFTRAFRGPQSIFMYATNAAQASGWQQRGSWTVMGPVTADSVTPNAGTGAAGAAQMFALAFGDTAGAMDLQQTWVWFNPTFGSSAAKSCMAYYQPATNTLNLIDDAGATWLSASLGGSGTLQNSQCAIALANSTAVPSGNTLTLTLAITFTPAFRGTQNIFMYATNGVQVSGWWTRGTWTVLGPVTADSVTPNAGTGATQTFVLAYGDTAGATDLQQAWVWFSGTLTSNAANSCMAYYQRETNTLNLLDDFGTTWLSAPLGSGTLQNNQCGIDLGNSTAVLSGNTLTLTLAVTFTQAVAGTSNIFMYASGGTETSGWQARGTWTVPSPPSPVTADSVTPNAGTGLTQAFVLTYGDMADATDLQRVWVSFDDPALVDWDVYSCLAYYDRATNTLNLWDTFAGWLAAPLGNGTLQNSACAIDLGSTTVVLSGNTLTLTLPMTFTPLFGGAHSIFMSADGSADSSGWQVRGIWTVPGPVVTADSVTPNAGMGATPAFALAYGDTAGATDLQQLWVWFNPTFATSAAKSCMAYYVTGTNTLNLIDDAGVTWLPAPLGSSGTLQNSQCAIDLAGSTAVPSGNTLTLTLAVTFTPEFAGTQKIFMYATNWAQASGWVTSGTWTVP